MSANEIRTIEADGVYFIDTIMEGEALSRRGPYLTADEAESAANQIVGIFHVLHQPMRIMPVPARKRCA